MFWNSSVFENIRLHSKENTNENFFYVQIFDVRSDGDRSGTDKPRTEC